MGFVIEDGGLVLWKVLEEYVEEPGVTEVTIPEGVEEIGESAFLSTQTLQASQFLRV